MKKFKIIILITLSLLIGACEQNSINEKPKPNILTDDAIGHSDKMIVVNHKGPKAQIFLKGIKEPLWFSSVRDAIAYIKSDEKTSPIIVAYVNDVGKAESWENMGKNNWIDVEDAFFVVGSDAIGGMGAPELVPFSNKEAALDFIKERGGEILLINDIDAEMVLAPVDHSMMDMENMPMDNMSEDRNMQMQANEDSSNND